MASAESQPLVAPENPKVLETGSMFPIPIWMIILIMCVLVIIIWFLRNKTTDKDDNSGEDGVQGEETDPESDKED